MIRAELADMLDRFARNAPDCGAWEWDDFTSVRAEPHLEPFRQRLLTEVDPLLGQQDQHPVIRARLNRIISELRTDARTDDLRPAVADKPILKVNRPGRSIS